MESWINAERAGSQWPLAVADFYLDHMIIHEPGELEPQDDQEDSPEDVDEQEELILDLLKNGEDLLQAGFKVFTKSVRGD